MYTCDTRSIRMCDLTHSYVDDEFIRMTGVYVRHDSFICVKWLVHMCDMTNSCMRHVACICVTHDSFICVTHDSFICVTHDSFICVTHDSFICVTHDSFICVACLIHTCDMTLSYVWHDSFIRVTWLITTASVTCRMHMFDTWLIHMCDVTYLYVLNSFICVTWRMHMCDTWLIHTCVLTHSYVWYACHSYVWLVCICDMTDSVSDSQCVTIRPYVRHDACTCVTHDSFVCVTWLIHTCNMTHSYVGHVAFIYVA